MSFSAGQMRDLTKRVLEAFDSKMASPAAIELVLGTAAVESQFGKYLRQIEGPALGAFQVEPVTFEWLRARYQSRYPELHLRKPIELEWDLRLGILMCRLRYWIDPQPLPPAHDLAALGATWKRVYNTIAGAGKPEDFVLAYRRFVAGGQP